MTRQLVRILRMGITTARRSVGSRSVRRTHGESSGGSELNYQVARSWRCYAPEIGRTGDAGTHDAKPALAFGMRVEPLHPASVGETLRLVLTVTTPSSEPKPRTASGHCVSPQALSHSSCLAKYRPLTGPTVNAATGSGHGSPAFQGASTAPLCCASARPAGVLIDGRRVDCCLHASP